jgi:hypothetical protein
VKYASFLCPPLRFAVDIASQQGPAYQQEANPSAGPFLFWTLEVVEGWASNWAGEAWLRQDSSGIRLSFPESM